jgi:hypothetical protein
MVFSLPIVRVVTHVSGWGARHNSQTQVPVYLPAIVKLFVLESTRGANSFKMYR